MMMTPKGTIGSKDVTLAYDDDTKGKIGFKDVTLAYDDDAKGNMGTRDVTLAYDFGCFSLKSYDGGIFLG